MLHNNLLMCAILGCCDNWLILQCNWNNVRHITNDRWPRFPKNSLIMILFGILIKCTLHRLLLWNFNSCELLNVNINYRWLLNELITFYNVIHHTCYHTHTTCTKLTVKINYWRWSYDHCSKLGLTFEPTTQDRIIVYDNSIYKMTTT